jgi:hypothetical protein
MYDEKMYDENEFDYDSSDTIKKKEELDMMALRDIFIEILEEFSYLEPMLSCVNFLDICYKSDLLYSKNSEKYFNKKIIFELSGILYDTIQKFLRNYCDIDDVFLDINQNKIYSRIVRSFNKYYALY